MRWFINCINPVWSSFIRNLIFQETVASHILNKLVWSTVHCHLWFMWLCFGLLIHFSRSDRANRFPVIIHHLIESLTVSILHFGLVMSISVSIILPCITHMINISRTLVGIWRTPLPQIQTNKSLLQGLIGRIKTVKDLYYSCRT